MSTTALSPAAPDDAPDTPEALRATAPTATASVRILATLAVIAALWWGQRFAIPLVAGLMLAMLVMPLAHWLENVLHSAGAAALVSLALVLGGMVGAGALFGAQLVRVIERTPQMISMAAVQLADRDTATESVWTRVRDALQQLDRAADRVIAGKSLTRTTANVRKATPVKAQPLAPAAATADSAAKATDATPNSNITETATEALRDSAVTGTSLLVTFAGNLSVIFFISFFVLTGGRPLTVRFLGLWGYNIDAHMRATRAMLECGRQIRIYVGVMVITNTAIGVIVWIAFMLTGLPDAGGWGVTAAVLHAMPYAGMAVLTGLGAAETFLAHASVGAALGMAAFLVTTSTLIGTLVTAWLQGRAARMNPASVFIGLVFWGCLWGLWGLFLGPALVVLFKVIAEHTESGHRLARLMQG